MIANPTEPAMLMVKAFEDAARHLVEIGALDDPDGGNLARAVMTMEGVVATGLASFDSMARIDTAWHTAMYSGAVEYDASIPEITLRGFRAWREMTVEILPTLNLLEKTGGPIAGADTLRAGLREASAILTPDDEFFAGTGLERLEREAIAADDRGETVEFGEMGD